MIDDSSILRCGFSGCNKKLTLTNNFECKCEFDYKNKQKELLQNKLKKITADKVIKI